MVKSVLITGCNRGIGLEFVRQFLTDNSPPEHVIATCRNPENAKDLNTLRKEHPGRLHILQLDVTHWTEYANLVKLVEDIVGVDKGLTLLINNAAILPELEELGDIDIECMLEAYKVNCVAPIILSKHFLPLLKKSSKNYNDETMSIHKSAIVYISSDWASIKERETSEHGSFYPYRCSKSALNMGMKNLSIDLEKDRILVTSIYPGWVQTDMGGPNGELTVEDSVSSMMKMMSNMTETNHGTFVQFDGAPMPW